MAKTNVKDLMMKKGERLVLMGAGALMVLLMIIGIINLADSPSPDEFIKDVDGSATRITNAISGPVVDRPVLPEWATGKPYIHSPVKSGLVSSLYFDPNAPPDNRRINPVILPITGIQAEFMHAKILGYDIKESEGSEPTIGVITYRPAKGEKVDRNKTVEFIRSLKGKKPLKKKVNPPGYFDPKNPLAQNPMGGIGAPGVGLPMGGIGVPGTPVGGGFPMSGGFGKGGFRDMDDDRAAGGQGYGPGGTPIESGERMGIDYVTLDPEKLLDKRLALTIYPQRMVIIQAAFPYKAQIEEIQKAMRLPTLADVFDPRNEAVPYFRGFVVERQMVGANGQAGKWEPLNIDEKYRETIFPRKFADKDEDLPLQYVLLHPDHELVMPLPWLLAGQYPEVKLPEIKETIKKMEALFKAPVEQKAPSQLKGQGSIFQPSTGTPLGLQGQPGAGDDNRFNIPTRARLIRDRDEVRPRGDGVGGAGQYAQIAEQLPDSVLVRIIDNDIVPGRNYKYRVKVRMMNPNWIGDKEKFNTLTTPDGERRPGFGPGYGPGGGPGGFAGPGGGGPGGFAGPAGGGPGGVGGVGDRSRYNSPWEQQKARKYELVSRPSDADTEILEGKFFEMEQTVSVPREEYLFATDPTPTESKDYIKGAVTSLKPHEGLLQLQRWLPIASVGNNRGTFKEPVADWIVADIVVKRGHYVGGKQFVNLPVWSSEYNRYILPEIPAEKGAKQKDPRRGVVMDPTKPGPEYIVVDIEGGRVETRGVSRNVSEDAACEILLLDEFGNLQVRNSADDRQDPERGKRETAWREWIDRTEKDTTTLVPQGLGGQKSRFDD